MGYIFILFLLPSIVLYTELVKTNSAAGQTNAEAQTMKLAHYALGYMCARPLHF